MPHGHSALYKYSFRRFQITHNLSLDGVLDFSNSKKMTEAGPLDLIDDDNSDAEEGIDKQTIIMLNLSHYYNNYYFD